MLYGQQERVCRDCTYYDPRAAQPCRERRIESLPNKRLGNFREYFEFFRRQWTLKPETIQREDTAHEQLKNCSVIHRRRFRIAA
jgi:hypothetical protein